MARSSRKGRIVALSISRRKGERKENIPEAEFIEDFGIAGDAHAGKWHRQVSLLAIEAFDEIRTELRKLKPGDFAENITTQGLDLQELRVGDILSLGDGKVLLEVTQLGKECHRGCAIRRQVGDCVMPRRGVFARVLKGGTVVPGESIEVLRTE